MKIPLNKIAEITATETGENQATILQFIKDLFSIVSEEVSKGNDVRIDGLGTFMKSNVLNEPIQFIPDGKFSAQLNEAFAMFSPVELNEEVTDQILSEADKTAESETMTEPEEKTGSEISLDNTTDTNRATDSSEGKSSETELSEPESISESEEIIEIPEIPIAPQVKDSESSTEIELDSDNEPPVEIEESDFIPEEEVEYVVVRKSKSRFFLGFTLGIILGFAIGVIAFFAYIVRILHVQVEDVFPF